MNPAPPPGRDLIIGGNGFIGRSLSRHLRSLGREILRTDRSPNPGQDEVIPLDLLKPPADFLIPEGVVRVFLCAGIPGIRLCEDDPQRTWLVNVKHTILLARRFSEAGIPVVFPSTNLVFGKGGDRIPATDPTAPMTEYARQKVEVEEALLGLSESNAVVRFTKILGPQSILIRKWVRTLRLGEAVEAFSDLYMSPVTVQFAVRVLANLGIRGRGGVWQVSGAGSVSYEDFCKHLSRLLGKSPALVKPDSYEFRNDLLAGNPSPTLDTTRIEQDLEMTPPSLEDVASELIGESTAGFEPIPEIPCHICGEPFLEMISGFENLRRVTSDCRPWPPGGRAAYCADCGAIQKPVDAVFRKETGEIYRDYAVYSQGGGKEQKSFSASEALPRSERILAFLVGEGVLPETGDLLDMGCGNGSLLEAFSKLLPRWILAGQELDDRNRGRIEKIPGVRSFFPEPLDSIDRTFDLVSLVHCLEHIPNPVGFLREARRLIRPAGRLLVQTPDLSNNPFDLGIADHCSHFSAQTLDWVLARSGFLPVPLAGDPLPREFTRLYQLGSRAPSLSVLPVVRARETLETALGYLECARKKTAKLADSGALGLLGTSISATWLSAEIGEGVRFFVDEDENRVGKAFLGRPVVAPAEVRPDSTVLVSVPGPAGKEIAERLGRSFHAAFLPLDDPEKS